MSKVFLRYFRHSRVRRISVLLIIFACWIEFGEAKQIIVALVATTFEALFSVAKTNSRLSGRELYTGNVYHLFGNMFTHTFTSSAFKKCAPKGTHRKNASLSLLLHKCLTDEGMRKERKHLLPKYFPFIG